MACGHGLDGVDEGGGGGGVVGESRLSHKAMRVCRQLLSGL